jgi:hypothetical protein
MLDEQMPLAVSAAMRFGLAAFVMTSLVLSGEHNNNNNNNKEKQSMNHHSMDHLSKEYTERGPATMAGLEIGAWYCAGYLCQAMGLETADASKVCTPRTVLSKRNCCMHYDGLCMYLHSIFF